MEKPIALPSQSTSANRSPLALTEVNDGKPVGKQVKIASIQYNYTNWTGTKGTVVVTKNANDASKVDIELKSITMRNDNATTDTKNTATDMLTGFIIKI